MRWFLIVALSAQDVSFRATVPVVVAPVTVTDSKGRLKNGLEPESFHVTDNGKPVNAKVEPVEWTTTPLALIVLVQANAVAGPALLKIEQVGSMIQPLLTGERGAAAVLVYADTIETRQDFTNDPTLLTRAFRGLKPKKEFNGRMLDGVATAVELFRRRPSGERRAIFLLGESRDRGSESTLETVHESLQKENIQLFAATYSNFKSQWTTRAGDLKQTGAPMDLAAGLDSLFRLGKVNTAEALTLASGGKKVGFSTRKGLEEWITRLGDELHGQYIVTFPATDPQGFHSIAVQVPGANVRTRQGYWR